MKKTKRIVRTKTGKLLLIAENGALTNLYFTNKDEDRCFSTDEILLLAEIQLQEYFQKNRKKFSIKINLEGTPFQRKVWKLVQQISYGKTISYSEIAKKMGDVKKARACARAIAKNPIPIIIPCHRVILKDGRIGGFIGGIENKRKLLQLENENFVFGFNPLRSDVKKQSSSF